jgi:hypothetical protein
MERIKMANKPRKPPGPKPERLILKGPWEKALRRAVTRNDPPKKRKKGKRRPPKE